MTELLGLARPWLLLLLLGIPLWLLWIRAQARRSSIAFAPLQYARRAQRRLRLWPAFAVELLLLSGLVVAVAGPYREVRLDLIDEEAIDVMLVLDVSLSMLAEDLEPNRLEALRGMARDFVARSGSNRVGVVAFAGDPFVHTPLTRDHRSLFDLLDDITVHAIDQNKSGGTAIGDALLVAGERLSASRVEGRDQSLILITDGESNLGVDPELAARWIAEQGMRLHAIGVGGTEPVEVFFEGRPVGGDDPYLAVLDDEQLRTVVAAAGGRFFRATDIGTLEEIFAELSRLERGPLELRTVAQRRYYSSSLALASLLLYGVHLALGGWLLRRPLR